MSFIHKLNSKGYWSRYIYIYCEAGKDMLRTHWRNSFWQVDFFHDTQLDRTGEIYFPSVFVEINLLLQQLDEPIPHIHIDIRPLHDSLVRLSWGGNLELFASIVFRSRGGVERKGTSISLGESFSVHFFFFIFCEGKSAYGCGGFGEIITLSSLRMSYSLALAWNRASPCWQRWAPKWWLTPEAPGDWPGRGENCGAQNCSIPHFFFLFACYIKIWFTLDQKASLYTGFSWIYRICRNQWSQ